MVTVKPKEKYHHFLAIAIVARVIIVSESRNLVNSLEYFWA